MDNNLQFILSELKCMVCHEYIRETIPLCAQGHGICKTCKKKCTTCPICKSRFEGARNRMLENIIHNVVFECQNKERGCTFQGNPVPVAIHMEECESGLYECPAKEIMEIRKCQWNGKLANVMKHLQTKHEDLSYNYNEVTSKNSFIYTLNSTFKVYRRVFTIDGTGEWVAWAVKYVGAASKAKQYKFKVEFIRQIENGPGCDIVLTSECVATNTDDKNIFTNNYVKVHADILKPFAGIKHIVEIMKI